MKTQNAVLRDIVAGINTFLYRQIEVADAPPLKINAEQLDDKRAWLAGLIGDDLIPEDELVRKLTDLVGEDNVARYLPPSLPTIFNRPEFDPSVTRQPHLPFYWKPHKKGSPPIQPRDMATSYLFNTIRMLFNNSVPPAFRVSDFARYDDIPRWDSEYRAQAITEMSKEISDRDDLDSDLRSKLWDMIANVGVIVELGL